MTGRKGYELGRSAEEVQRIADLRRAVERLRPLEVPLGPPEPDDWLAVHFEPGQDLEQYLGSRPATARGTRRVLYIQPLGDFSPGQRRVVEVTGTFLERFFALPVRTLDGVPLAAVPAAAQRRHPEWGDHQVLTGWVLDDQDLDDDAALHRRTLGLLDG